MKKSSPECRVCLKKQEKEKFQRVIAGKNEIAEKLYFVAQIMILDLKNLPTSFICKTCLTNLTHAAKFKKLALESDKIFNKKTKSREIELWRVDIKKEEEDEDILLMPPAVVLKEEESVDVAAMLNFEDDIKDDFDFGDHFDIDFNAEPEIIPTIPTETDTKPKIILKDSDDDEIKAKNDDFDQFTKAERKAYKYSDKFKCWCGVKLTSGNSLRNHQHAVHTEIKPEDRPICDFCGKSYKVKSYVWSHIKKMHLNNKKDDDKQPCSVCGKLLTVSALKYHEERHLMDSDKMTRFVCDLCGFATSRHVYLRKHIESSHLKLLRYKCKYCDFSAPYGSKVFHHQRLHNKDPKMYKCQYCGKEFTRKYSCLLHERSHTNVRTYSCRFCMKTFIHHSDLRRHELRHTGGIKKKDYDELIAKGVHVPLFGLS